MKDSEIIFAVEESPEGGYEAHALGHTIFTQAESMDELREMVRDAVRCHFDTKELPTEIRLHFVGENSPGNHELAMIGRSLVVKGTLSGSEDLVIDGTIEGSIILPGRTLTIGPNARVHANIEGRDVVLHGKVNGDINAARRVELRKSASLCGNISTSRISIEDGAYFKGTIDIHKTDPTPSIAAELMTLDEVITA